MKQQKQSCKELLVGELMAQKENDCTIKTPTSWQSYNFSTVAKEITIKTSHSDTSTIDHNSINLQTTPIEHNFSKKSTFPYKKLHYSFLKNTSLFNKSINNSTKTTRSVSNKGSKIFGKKEPKQPTVDSLSLESHSDNKNTESTSKLKPSKTSEYSQESGEMDQLIWLSSNLDLESPIRANNDSGNKQNRRLSLQQNNSTIEITDIKHQRKMSTVHEPDTIIESFDDSEHGLVSSKFGMSAIEMAKLMYHDSNSLTAKKIYREDYAAFLGTKAPFNSQVLQQYCSLFKFDMMSIDVAFRLFCSKLYLKGESQIIDRILFLFSKRYRESNSNSPLSVDYIYAITYAMLLLNTDLHLANNNSKMSKSQFVNNTLNALTNIKDTSTSPSSFPEISRHNSASKTLKSFSTTYENIESTSHKSNIAALLKEIYISIKNSPIIKHDINFTPKSAKIADKSSTTLTYSSSNSTINSNNKSIMTNRDKYCSKMDKTVCSSGQPSQERQNLCSNSVKSDEYEKSSKTIMFRKTLSEAEGKRSNSRSWKEFLVEVNFSHHELKMSKSDRYTYFNSHSNSENKVVFNLLHALAVVLPNGYSISRPHVFALQLTNGSVTLLQARTQKEINKFVSAINYVAAKYSTIPLDGGINNIDYGWDTDLSNSALSLENFENGLSSDSHLGIDNDLLNLSKTQNDPKSPISSYHLFNNDTISSKRSTNSNVSNSIGSNMNNNVNIHEWRVPAFSQVPNKLTTAQQIKKLDEYINKLNKDLISHMDKKRVIDNRFNLKSALHQKAFSNYEKKAQFLLRETVRYQTYLEALQTESNV